MITIVCFLPIFYLFSLFSFLLVFMSVCLSVSYFHFLFLTSNHPTGSSAGIKNHPLQYLKMYVSPSLCIFISPFPFLCMCASPSLCFSIFPSSSLCLSLSLRLSVSSCVCLSLSCLSLSVFLFLHLSVYPALCYSISPSLSF
jgi:hypothetical protein